jgi:hypothetical protein
VAKAAEAAKAASLPALRLDWVQSASLRNRGPKLWCAPIRLDPARMSRLNRPERRAELGLSLRSYRQMGDGSEVPACRHV